MAHLLVRDLAVGWQGQAVLRGMDFQVERGDIFVILGGSGSGKSTLLRALIGLEAPLAGSIHIEGVGDPRRAAGGRPPFGVLFQSSALFGSLTVGENVALPLRHWTRLPEEAIEAVVAARLRLVGLEPYRNHLPAEVSGGMRKRAGIARALALDPELLFLDEPSAGLDPVTSAGLDRLILRLNRALGVTMVIVTHELDSILAIGRSCIMVDGEEGRILAAGVPQDLQARPPHPKVARFFAREPEEI